MQTAQLRKFKGGGGTRYVDLATRGSETMGVAIEYAKHPFNGVGFAIVRFVAYAQDQQFQPFTHFTEREQTKFYDLTKGEPKNETEYKASKFIGVRLNKIAIPMFVPAPSAGDRDALKMLVDGHQVAQKIADWIIEQLATEGFMPVLDELVAHVRRSLLNEFDASAVQSVLEFPDLKAIEKPSKSHSHEEEGGDGDEFDVDDEDDSPKGGKKGWFN